MTFLRLLLLLRWLLLVPVLAGCVQQTAVHVDPTAETFDQQLQRTEGVSCADITGHAEGDAPDCQKLFEAFDRGRTRVMGLYSKAQYVKMSAIQFYRPKRYWTEPAPIINLLPEEVGLLGAWGATSDGAPILISYSWEDVVEHEATHAIVQILDPGRLRKPEDVAASVPSQRALLKFYNILCHGTPDDPLGTPGQTASCIRGYQP